MGCSMFQRFADGGGSPIGIRGGALAVGVHAAILLLGFRGVQAGRTADRPVAVSGIIWMPPAPARPPVGGSAPVIPAPDPIAVTLPAPPTLRLPVGAGVEPGAFAVPVTPPAGGFADPYVAV